MSLTLWLVESGRRHVLVAVGLWTLIVVALSWAPLWARLGANAVVWLDLAYMWGVMHERKRRMADARQHDAEMASLIKAAMVLAEAVKSRQPLPPSEEIN